MSNKKVRIPFNRPYVTGEESCFLQDVLYRRHLKGDGYYTEKCSIFLQELIGCKRALLTTSCTSALELAAMLLDIKVGDEIIMPSFTFVSTANAFVLRGGIPVFVDIRNDTFNLDENKIIAAITKKTKAICVVHYAGIPCNMEAIRRIALAYNLKIVEDAAQAFGSYYKGSPIGNLGDLVCFSFHETKNIIAGEGGALIINDPNLIEKAEIFREKGTNRTQFIRGLSANYTWIDIGSSFLPSELVAAFLYSQLLNMQKIQKKRLCLYNKYREIQTILPENVSTQSIPVDIIPNGHLFGLLFPDLDHRISFMDYMEEVGIHTAFHFIPLHNSPAGIKYTKTSGELSVTERIASGWVRLPLYPELQDSELTFILDSCAEFLSQGKHL